MDGAVHVTVASTGAIVGLRLDERVRGLAVDELAREILTTTRRAQSRLADEVAGALTDTIGADSETGRAVLGTYAYRFPAEARDGRS